MKTTALTMLVGVLTIIGTPLFSGWYSKDMILAQAWGFARTHPEHSLLFILPLVTAAITAFYMFRMWFMTFTGEPRDQHVYDHAHEAPWSMTFPLIILAVLSWLFAWGWPIHDPAASWLLVELRHAQPAAVETDFQQVDHAAREFVNSHGLTLHEVAGFVALAIVGIGLVFATLVYYYRTLDAAETKEQFAPLHSFLSHKWYFDELYSVFLVRPTLVLAHGCRAIDLFGIDSVLHAVANATKWLSWAEGKFDNGVIDGLVNLLANVTFRVGVALRQLQTGYLRSYVLFLVLAVIGIVIALSYVVMAVAGG
jgi:NADH-quinone oxidoreductase subunit L